MNKIMANGLVIDWDILHQAFYQKASAMACLCLINNLGKDQTVRLAPGILPGHVSWGFVRLEQLGIVRTQDRKTYHVNPEAVRALGENSNPV